jgi:hypothetical protein
MELIGTSCFMLPAPANVGMREDYEEWVVCTAGDPGFSHGDGAPAMSELRCGHCGGPVHIDLHHLAWYTH